MLNNIKKIALVINSLQAGGMERVMSELAEIFSRNNDYEVHLILYGITRDNFYEIPENVIIHKPIFKFNDKQRFISTLRTISFLRKKIKSIRPDTTLSFGEYWNNMVLLSTIGLPFPVYVSDRSQPNKSLGKVHDQLRKWLYPKATGIILQTKKAKEIYQEQFKNLNITIIGNPIREIKNKKNIDKENIVLMVGRLIETKHQDRLIEIFAKISNPAWKLVLVGGDALKQSFSEKLRLKIDELKMNDKIVLAGIQSDVESFYLKSKIFAYTSSSEGFPNVIGEAMSAGLPVISYDCVAGPSEMINDSEDGYLIPLFNDDLFQEKLSKLMVDNDLRIKMGNKAKESIKKFDKVFISQQFLDFILSHTK